MKTHFKRVVSMLLVITLAVSIFTACGNDNGKKDEEAAASITASAVRFLSSGNYKTTLKSKDIDLSKLSKKNVEVTYIGYDDGTVLASDKAAKKIKADKYADGERFTKLNSVKKNSDGTCEISFKDDNAVKYGVTQYNVRLNSLKQTVPVEVKLPELTVTTDTTDISAATHEAKITLTLKGGEFEKNPKADYITLSNAFEKMKVESISASGKNMTMLLKGNIITNGIHGAYLYGTIGVAPEAIKNYSSALRTNVNIISEFAGFDGSTLKYADGKVTVDLKAYGCVDIDKLTKDNIKIDGVTVEKVEKKDDNTASVTMTAKNIKNGNDFVKLVTDKKADFNGYKDKTNLYEASFYPVFDYCEADGDNLKMTLKAYVYNGTFDKGLKPEAISLGDDFKGGKTESVKVAKDGTSADIVVSVPANGQKEDEFKINGELTLAEGSLVNAWNEKNTEKASYSRIYSNETLGKKIDWDETWSTIVKKIKTDDSIDEISINKKSLQAIQDWVRGKNNWFGAVLYWGNVGASVFSFGKMMLELTGVLKSEHQQIMEQFQAIREMLVEIDLKLEDQRKTLANIEEQTYINGLEKYETDYKTMCDAMDHVEYVYEKAAQDLEKQGLTLSEDASEKETEAYTKQMMTYIYKRANKDGGVDPTYGKFIKRFGELEDSFRNVAGYYLGGEGSNSPLEKYDKLYALKYNFDTQTYSSRFLQRETLRARLTEAIPLFATNYQVSEDYSKLDKRSSFGQLYNAYKNAINELDKHEVQGNSPETVYFTNQEVEVEELVDSQYVSDIMLVGKWKDRGDEMLKAEGYTPIPYDLNKGAGGMYVYLGYKQSSKYDDAIKDFKIMVGKEYKDKSTITIDGITYKQAPVMEGSDKEFIESNGDLNEEAGGKYIYLYYTKEDTPKKEAITNILINNQSENSVDGVDLNKGAGGDDIFMHVTVDPKGENYIRSLMLEAKYLGDKTNVNYENEKSPYMNKYTIYPQNLNAGAEKKCTGYHVYLGAEMTDNYKEAVKDIKLVATRNPKQSFTENGATYNLVPTSGMSSGFESQFGNLNFGSSVNSAYLYMYYTKDEVEDKQAVTKISFDNNGENAVSSMNLNYNVGGDVIYMHIEKQDKLRYHKVKRLVGIDPAHHPYSYVLGSTVGYVPVSDLKDKDQAEYKNKALGFKAKRDWTKTEVTKFAERLGNKTLGKEFELAGIPSDKYLATKLEKYKFGSSEGKFLDVLHIIKGEGFGNNGSVHITDLYFLQTDPLSDSDSPVEKHEYAILDVD